MSKLDNPFAAIVASTVVPCGLINILAAGVGAGLCLQIDNGHLPRAGVLVERVDDLAHHRHTRVWKADALPLSYSRIGRTVRLCR